MRQPRLGRQAFGFKGFDFVGLAQGQTDIVKTVQQTELAKRLYFKRNFFALGPYDNLFVQVNCEFIAGKCQGLVKQQVHRRFGNHDGQQAVFKTVVKKDVCKAWGQDGSETKLV